ncbi:MAG: radical SAM protein [Desulfobacteraceae bacterium]|nr:radical SAM protein [Desulfobacteraceae bacterium]MBC2757255.1 radical SAM protein [Desulfobacteraceae bacterium]
MNDVPQQFLNEVRQLLFKDKTSELRAYHAIRHFKRTVQIFPFKPESIQIQTHSFCNGRCLYCPYPAMSQKLKQGKMGKDMINKIADDLTKWDMTGRVTFMLQNEPLMDKDFIKIINHFKSLNPKIELATVTNGTFLTPFLINQIVHSSLDELTISLDAFSKDTYESLHPGFKFEKILDSIHMLARKKDDRLSARLSFVNTRQNRDELSDFIKFTRKNCMGYRVIQVLNRANNVKNYNTFRSPRLTWKYLKLRLIYKYFFQACFLPFIRMSILFNGDVILCCNDWHRDAVVGNVNNESVDQIWNGQAMNHLRKKIVEKKYHEIRTCSQCTLAQLCV